MIFYCWTALNCWTALSGSSPESVAMGITDVRGRAMQAGEEILESGQAVTVIIEAVRPAMAPATLAPCYMGTGVSWLGRRTRAGSVYWKRFFSAPSLARGWRIPAPMPAEAAGDVVGPKARASATI